MPQANPRDVRVVLQRISQSQAQGQTRKRPAASASSTSQTPGEAEAVRKRPMTRQYALTQAQATDNQNVEE